MPEAWTFRVCCIMSCRWKENIKLKAHKSGNRELQLPKAGEAVFRNVCQQRPLFPIFGIEATEMGVIPFF